MRKITLAFLPALLLVALSGCLKDKDFENDKYGIRIDENKGVAFTQSSKSPVVVGINSQSTSLTVDGPLLALESGEAIGSPVTVTVQINQQLVTDAGLIPLQMTDFSINSLTVTIPAGQKVSDALKITIPNSGLLDPNQSYGIGFTITSVDNGYKIAANQKNVVIAFNIKNKYDGVYLLKGKHNRSPYLFPYELEVEMITAGPTSVAYFLPDPAVNDYGHPIGTASGWSHYGNTLAPVLTFDGTTNQITGVHNGGGATPLFLHTGPGINNYYDPLTKTIYAHFYYVTGAGQDFTNRGWSDTLTYIGPR
jgi:hypothetical protein